MRTMSECAAQNPARLSLTTFSTALISFFIRASPDVALERQRILDQPCDFLRELAQQRVQLVVLLLAAKIGQHQRETPASLPFLQQQQPPRMRAVIGFEKPVPFLRREMADLDDGVDMLRRDRRLIGRVGDLRDEAAVLAERFGQTLAHAGRPLDRARRAGSPCRPQSDPASPAGVACVLMRPGRNSGRSRP